MIRRSSFSDGLYFLSPMIGWPMAAICTRIWFCNPVTSETRTSEAAFRRCSTE